MRAKSRLHRAGRGNPCDEAPTFAACDNQSRVGMEPVPRRGVRWLERGEAFAGWKLSNYDELYVIVIFLLMAKSSDRRRIS